VFFFYQAFTFSNSNPSLPRPPPWYCPNPPTCVRIASGTPKRHFLSFYFFAQ